VIVKVLLSPILRVARVVDHSPFAIVPSLARTKVTPSGALSLTTTLARSRVPVFLTTSW
jgi:acetolactate synthase regulatory subunit